MAEPKRASSRLSSFRESVKKITERLSDGDSQVVKKNEEYVREIEKLRIQIQSMEAELRQLHQSRYQLEQAHKHNERLSATLQRYPTQPDTTWPYATFQSPPSAAFQSLQPTIRPAAEATLPGLRAVAYMDRFPLAFIVDTRGLTLAERHMEQATTMGLDITRAQLISTLRDAAQNVPPKGPAVLVYRR